MQISKFQKGFTLIELMVVITILATVVALSVPSFSRIIERKRLEGAAEKIVADFYYAKTQAIKMNTSVFVSFDETNQCYGLALEDDPPLTPNCDCTEADVTQADACTLDGATLRVVNLSDYGDSEIASTTLADDETEYDPRRGRAINTGRVFLDSPRGFQAQVRISTLRILICSVAGSGKVIALQNCP